MNFVSYIICFFCYMKGSVRYLIGHFNPSIQYFIIHRINHVYAFTSYFLKGMIYFFFHLLALRRTPKMINNRPGTFTHGLGLHVTGIGDGWAEGELTAGDGMLNPLGIVHGGVYAAMMDHVAGTAACSRGSTCRTVNYDLHYLAPAQPGLLRCRAESVRMGQQIVVMQVWVEDAQGVRCAEGCYTFRCKPAEHKD